MSKHRQISKYNRRTIKKLEEKRNGAVKAAGLYETAMKNPANALELDNVCTCFFTDTGTVRAVDGVSFNIPKRSTVCVVGESGCGKSVTSLSVMQLLQRPAGQVVSGEIRLNAGGGRAYNIVNTPDSVMREIRGSLVSMIFQEPMTSLNPVFKIGTQIEEVLLLHGKDKDKAFIKKRVLDMLELVGIANKEGVYNMYPHELSGGMRQRVMIAMAVACTPSLIIADEPTTALDVTIQAQILDLLKGLKEKLNASIMLITHDLGVVAAMADYVVIMYAGRVVEKGTAEDIFRNPCHPYTLGLIRARPALGKRADRLYTIKGSVPDPADRKSCCYFRERCSLHTARCGGDYPPETAISATHTVCCYRFAKKEPLP